MSEICKAKYRWTREELISAMRHHHQVKLRREIRLLVKIFAVIMLAFIGMLLFVWTVYPANIDPPFWGLLFVASVCVYCLIQDKLNAWYWGRGFAKRPDANTEIEWQFSQNELKIETELGKATLRWKGFLKVVETGEGFLFYSVKNIFNWLPFSGFESPECIEQVRTWVQENDIPVRRVR